VQITKVDASRHDSHRWPVFLPDGKQFLYLAVTHRSPSDAADAIYLGSLDGTETLFVMPSVTNIVLNQGHILFLRENQLMAQEFDANKASYRAALQRLLTMYRMILLPGMPASMFRRTAFWSTGPAAELSHSSHGLIAAASNWHSLADRR